MNNLARAFVNLSLVLIGVSSLGLAGCAANPWKQHFVRSSDERAYTMPATDEAEVRGFELDRLEQAYARAFPPGPAPTRRQQAAGWTALFNDLQIGYLGEQIIPLGRATFVATTALEQDDPELQMAARQEGANVVLFGRRFVAAGQAMPEADRAATAGPGDAPSRATADGYEYLAMFLRHGTPAECDEAARAIAAERGRKGEKPYQ